MENQSVQPPQQQSHLLVQPQQQAVMQQQASISASTPLTPSPQPSDQLYVPPPPTIHENEMAFLSNDYTGGAGVVNGVPQFSSTTHLVAAKSQGPLLGPPQAPYYHFQPPISYSQYCATQQPMYTVPAHGFPAQTSSVPTPQLPYESASVMYMAMPMHQPTAAQMPRHLSAHKVGPMIGGAGGPTRIQYQQRHHTQKVLHPMEVHQQPETSSVPPVHASAKSHRTTQYVSQGIGSGNHSTQLERRLDAPTIYKTSNRQRVVVWNFCQFCQNNREPEEFYRSHILRDASGKVVCPVLRAYNCPICNNGGGEKAHTKRYCPQMRNRSSHLHHGNRRQITHHSNSGSGGSYNHCENGQ